MRLNTIFFAGRDNYHEWYIPEILKELKNWLSCYYENGNIRSAHELAYCVWLSEVNKIKRLIDLINSLNAKGVLA